MAVFTVDYQDKIYIHPITGESVVVPEPSTKIIFCHNHKQTPPIWSLIDSGADRNLFPLGIAEFLGINLKKVPVVKIGGIGNLQIEAQAHPIEIIFQGKRIITSADFSPQQTTPILGRKGFFNHFDSVKFMEKEKQVILEIRTNSN